MKLVKIKALFANTFRDRLLGLISHEKPQFILFQTRFGIHTFFLAYSIDILVLDNDFRVKLVKTNLKPWRFYFYHPRYQYVLEGPRGYIKKKHIKYDDKIILTT